MGNAFSHNALEATPALEPLRAKGLIRRQSGKKRHLRVGRALLPARVEHDDLITGLEDGTYEDEDGENSGRIERLAVALNEATVALAQK